MKVGVVGAGTMGRGIAQICAIHGHTVALFDLSPSILAQSLVIIAAALAKHKPDVPTQDIPGILGRISTHTALTALADAEIIIEAAIEELEAKKQIFRELDGLTGPGALLATNTSSLPVTAIASAVRIPSRVAGLHFFNPPARMSLVEVIRGSATSAETIERLRVFASGIGKTAITVKDTPGFVVNRIARPFYGEALRLLGEGVAPVEEIDRIVRLEGGFKMGPFELIDLIGVDVNLAVTRSMYEQTFGEPRYRPHIIQQTMATSGLLGRKSGRGFYSYK